MNNFLSEPTSLLDVGPVGRGVGTERARHVEERAAQLGLSRGSDDTSVGEGHTRGIGVGAIRTGAGLGRAGTDK